jgi:hypothetical protein
MIQILLIGGAIFAFVKLIGFWGKRQSWIEAYQQVGRRYLGKKSVQAGVSCPTPLSSPTLSFGYRNSHCTVSTRRSKAFLGSRRVTHAGILLPWNCGDWEVTTGEFSSWRSFRNRRKSRLTFEQPEFQANFRVAAQKPQVAKEHLNDQVRWQIEQIRRFSDSKNVCIQVNNNLLTVAVPDEIRTQRRLDDFVRLSLKLYDLLALTKAAGVSFVQQDAVALLEDVQCPICSESIEQQMVVCIRCQTPHCRDCWEYNGQCATFACQETRFLDAATKCTQSAPVKG